LSLGFLTGKLEKEFIPHEDVSNDLSSYKTLLKWLKKLVDSSVDFLMVVEATGVYH
jgi:transposase